MHKAIRIVASSFGAFAGFGGIEHGIFEIMQGNVAPGGVTISSIGPPCVPELAWNQSGVAAPLRVAGAGAHASIFDKRNLNGWLNPEDLRA